jgi:hypothetical protein
MICFQSTFDKLVTPTTPLAPESKSHLGPPSSSSWLPWRRSQSLDPTSPMTNPGGAADDSTVFMSGGEAPNVITPTLMSTRDTRPQSIAM